MKRCEHEGTQKSLYLSVHFEAISAVFLWKMTTKMIDQNVGDGIFAR